MQVTKMTWVRGTMDQVLLHLSRSYQSVHGLDDVTFHVSLQAKVYKN